MRFILSIGTFFLLVTCAYSADPLTVGEAVDIAARTHPQVVEARAVVAGTEARVGQALANYYPQITIAADWNNSRSFLTSFGGIKETELHSAAAYLRQTFYDFGRTSGAVDSTRENREAARYALTVTRQDLVFRVKSAFYLVLATERQITATRETVKLREDVYQQAREFFQQGIRPKVDVARAEANLYTARTALVRAENNRELARVELASAMGVDSLGERPLMEPPFSEASVPGRERLQQAAFTGRAELKRLNALQSAAVAGLQTAKAGYLPVLSGSASAGYADKDFPPDSTVWSVGINLTVPIFSGFATVEQVRETQATIRAVEAQRDGAKLQIIKEVESAWLGVREATARISSTGKEVEAVRESRTLSMARYQEGVGIIIEISDAQAQALDAETANIQAVYDHQVAMARLDRAVGKE